MKISHHFDDATLMAYSAGSLPQGMALLVACHLHWCEQCRERTRETDAVGGAMLDSLTPAMLTDDALNAVLACLDEPEQEFSLSKAEPLADDHLPAPLAQVLGKPIDDLPWKRIGYGVRQLDLELDGPGATRLLRISPGVSVPHHTHSGNELTLILQGSYSDEMGRFCRGDVADLDGEVSHQPIVDTDEDCICLIATDAPLKFSGLMGRLVQPFIGL
ncbi:ChrR family anti-sigma-E factor [Marinobacterium sediminicola]|uniref:Anti-ECFsigma factor, ChrR n=1 Tax=Marinobacterium sediminicola TaxID=518898 RepID=A0ABY1S3E5_9GAMM|nr:ChrR family anti-sigma-E factor [Marinobacterium sediminicola]ULG68241.1 ChrR family anti-sigma-E factor [Marinobacterium sediminicola]SMR77789.1 anti-ECFsigma factor, ChrR [Marinobacterium sediminicola]